MSNKKNFRQRRTSSSSEEESDTIEITDEISGVVIKVSKHERLEELKFIQKQRERKHGIDVYSLAIGEQTHTKATTTKDEIDNDPWKKKTGGLVDLKVLQERRGNEIATSMASNFAKETNQRDEDAEMQKFIDEQIQLKKQVEKIAQALKQDGTPVEVHIDPATVEQKFKRPEDALFDLPKYLIDNKSKHRSEESLSEQMLSGIPEVDLGVSERIRNIEDTEKAKQKLVTARNSSHTTGTGKNKLPNSNDSQYAPNNTSVNFVQHKRFDDTLINPDHMVKPRINRPATVKVDNQPVVGDAPKHELLLQASFTQAASSYTKKSHQNTSKPNPNARRQYHVSTNMNEEHNNPESMGQVCAANVDVVAKVPEEAGKDGEVVDVNKEVVEEKKDEAGSKKSSGKRTATEKASDDYCLDRFKKNMRHSRSSKIKVA